MRIRQLIASAVLGLFAASAGAQTAPPPPNQDKWGIVVTGQRPDGKRPEMSDWHVAETEHVVVYGKDEDRLKRVAHNLEKEHFLLSVLFNRVDTPDDTAKLRVIMIGDTPDFQAMKLVNLRWQQGPYPRVFPTARYYDPRDDGAVLATTYTDQKILLRQAYYKASKEDFPPTPESWLSTGATADTPNTAGGAFDFATALDRVGEISFPMTAEGRLYASYAQHYLMTYFPAAYPRWFIDGFGEVFATLKADKPGEIEYGAMPEGYLQVLDWYSSQGYPIRRLLDGSYLNVDPKQPHWTPYHAWALVHLLFFSEEWKASLHNYLAAAARGADPAAQAAALGDVARLQRQLAGYRGRKVPFERLTYPPDRAAPPIIRQLTRNEAAILRGRLEMGARVELPPAPPPGTDPATAKRMDDARHDAIAARDSWLAKLRENAAEAPSEFPAQLLLAEGECRTGNDAECLAAADRALALVPESSPALAWKGVALVHIAVAGPTAGREAKLEEARALIVRANHADTEATLPLIAYYRSFADAGEAPPDIALEGLAKASESVPSAPTTRLLLGEALAARGDAVDARRALLPIADGPYDSPERARAREVLASVAH